MHSYLGSPVYTSGPGVGFDANIGVGGANANLAGSSYFTNDLINTGLSVLAGLFALSLIMQVFCLQFFWGEIYLGFNESNRLISLERTLLKWRYVIFQ